MPDPRREFGDRAESIAATHLKKNGYRILEKNFRNHLGEVDIIARHGNCIVFVEVKARKSLRFGNPKYAVTRSKRQSISKVALSYLKSTGQSDHRARFDVVSMVFGGNEKHPDIELIQNAFELEYGC
jgi:putative endonuclease